MTPPVHLSQETTTAAKSAPPAGWDHAVLLTAATSVFDCLVAAFARDDDAGEQTP